MVLARGVSILGGFGSPRQNSRPGSEDRRRFRRVAVHGTYSLHKPAREQGRYAQDRVTIGARISPSLTVGYVQRTDGPVIRPKCSRCNPSYPGPKLRCKQARRYSF